jgi:hypothetical protein
LFHTIEFTKQLSLVVLVSLTQPLERLFIHQGTRLNARIKPYVAETEDGFVEVADLSFEDGSTTNRVPFACFAFVE